jgi:hypothetical protein
MSTRHTRSPVCDTCSLPQTTLDDLELSKYLSQFRCPFNVRHEGADFQAVHLAHVAAFFARRHRIGRGGTMQVWTDMARRRYEAIEFDYLTSDRNRTLTTAG